MSEILSKSLDVSLIPAASIRDTFWYLVLYGPGCVGQYQIVHDYGGVIHIIKGSMTLSMGNGGLLFRIMNQHQSVSVLNYSVDFHDLRLEAYGDEYHALIGQDDHTIATILMQYYNDVMNELLLHIPIIMILVDARCKRFTYS